MTEVLESEQVEETLPDEPETEGDDAAADDEEEAAGEEEPGEPAPEDIIGEAQIDMSERAIKARDKALEKEHKRHEGVLERAWGALWADFELCPLCEGDGFMVPRPAGAMPPEQFAAVTAFAGQMQAPDLPDDKDYVVCDNCLGWGQTNIAGSKREGLSKQCNRCLGNGYVPTTNVTQPPQAYVIPGPVDAPAPLAIQTFGAPGPDDQWGRPTGHAHYGIPPAAVT